MKKYYLSYDRNISFYQNYVLFIGGDYVIQEIINKFSLFITRKGWTQEKAAEEIECSQEHLSRVLRGKKTPSVKLLMKMEETMKKEE